MRGGVRGQKIAAPSSWLGSGRSGWSAQLEIAAAVNGSLHLLRRTGAIACRRCPRAEPRRDRRAEGLGRPSTRRGRITWNDCRHHRGTILVARPGPDVPWHADGCTGATISRQAAEVSSGNILKPRRSRTRHLTRHRDCRPPRSRDGRRRERQSVMSKGAARFEWGPDLAGRGFAPLCRRRAVRAIRARSRARTASRRDTDTPYSEKVESRSPSLTVVSHS